MDMTKFKVPGVVVQHVEVAEKIGRISVDGEVDGRFVATTFMVKDLPKRVKTDWNYYEYLRQRLQEAAQAKKEADNVDQS
ncbi:hypothetical protein LCGC14_0632130 [marine sediment metagenome]|uniref:Uncharacterized protein n=1 Tax=marine sediment metagenome TaxID=412755 RepID=A0A0F9UA49_9ZZZZ